MSKSKEYIIERRKKPGTYSEDLENEYYILFPLKGCGDRFTTEASASVAISELTSSWTGWQFRVTPVVGG